MKRALITSLVLSLTIPVLVAGPAAGASCTLPREETAELPGGRYVREWGNVVGTHAYFWVELWEERNGEPGLQTYRFRCSAGDAYDPDFKTFQVCTRSMDASLFCVVYL